MGNVRGHSEHRTGHKTAPIDAGLLRIYQTPDLTKIKTYVRRKKSFLTLF